AREFFRPLKDGVDTVLHVGDARFDGDRRCDPYRFEGRTVRKGMSCGPDQQTHAIAKVKIERLSGTTLRGLTKDIRPAVDLARHDEVLTGRRGETVDEDEHPTGIGPLARLRPSARGLTLSQRGPPGSVDRNLYRRRCRPVPPLPVHQLSDQL